jgi:hypothetical protein
VKHACAAALVIAAIAVAPMAHAQVYGQFTPAPTVPLNGHQFGGYVTASESVLGGLAQLRLSFYPDVDFGFQGGLTRFDRGAAGSDLTTLRLGTDVRWQIKHQGANSPVDATLGGALAVETADNFKVVTLGPTFVVSRPVGGASAALTPYAGLGLLFVSHDAFGFRDNDVSVPLRLGLDARVAPDFRIIAELQLFLSDRYNDDVGFATGVNLPF